MLLTKLYNKFTGDTVMYLYLVSLITVFWVFCTVYLIVLTATIVVNKAEIRWANVHWKADKTSLV